MSDLKRFQLDRHNAAVAVIDVQEKLVTAMDPKRYGRMRDNIEVLLKGAGLLGVPVVATEQYPRGLGSTVGELQAACRDKVVEKVSFSCCGEPAFLDHLKALGKKQIIITGMEAHVCVYQTVLDLLENGYYVHLVRDAVISRRGGDELAGVENAARAGAVPTTVETVLFQLMKSSKSAEFKAVSSLIKDMDK
jgi:nicotinamidase-related amidase